MSRRALTREEIAQVTLWVADAFDSYATKFDSSEGQSLVRQCGKRFADTVRTDKELREDLADLMTRGCPAIAVVNLMLICTSEFHFTIADALEVSGITEKGLRDLKKNLEWMPEFIRTLTHPHFPGPLSTLAEVFPNKNNQRRVRRLVGGIPDALQDLGELLKTYPPPVDPVREAIADNEFVLSFYLLLARFKKPYATLSRLLRAMRQVRQTVSPEAPNFHKISPTVVSSGDKKGQRIDPLSALALQQGLRRYCKKLPAAMLQAHVRVEQYMSDRYARQRKRGKTFFEFILSRRGEESANSPEASADSLTKNLKLGDEQRSKVVTIFYEENERIAKLFIAMSPAGTAAPIYPNPLFHKDIDFKLQQIGQRTDHLLRNVLNLEQKRQFDLMRQAENEEFDRLIMEMKKHKPPENVTAVPASSR